MVTCTSCTQGVVPPAAPQGLALPVAPTRACSVSFVPVMQKTNEHLNVPPVAQNADKDAHPHINVIGGKHRKYALSAYINDFDAHQFYGQTVTWIFRVVDISKKVHIDSRFLRVNFFRERQFGQQSSARTALGTSRPQRLICSCRRPYIPATVPV